MTTRRARQGRKRGFNGGAGFTLVELMITVAIVGILAILGTSGVRRYLANGKSAEARSAVGAIGKAAARALEREIVDSAVLSAGGGTVISRRLCQTSNFVPGGASIAVPKGSKYQPDNSVGADYHFYDSDPNARNLGWSCLKYEMTMPQSYCYHYISDATDTTTGTFTRVRARGDLNGDGITSRFTLEGGINAPGDALTLAPSMLEENPDE